MSQESVEIVRRGFTVLEPGGLDAVAELWHPDINWRAIEGAPDDVGEMHGIDAARRYVKDWFDTFDELTAEPEELLDVGNNRVLAVVRVSGRGPSSGIPSELRYASVSTIREGKIVEVREYATKQEALKAVGLEEQAMSQENVELIERAVAAINARDIEGYLGCCTEEIKLETPMAAVGGVYEGTHSIRRYFADIDDAAPDFRIALDGVDEVDSKRVIAYLRSSGVGRASGIRMAPPPLTNVYDLLDGKISRVRIFLDRHEALKAVGREE